MSCYHEFMETPDDLLKEQWLKEENAPFAGWDFSYLKDRWNEENPPWDYLAMAKSLVEKSQAVLDMGTGGGERFSRLAPLPRHTVAIEGYKPNVAVARERLEPMGVTLIEVDESGELPFQDAEFDLVLNRHSAFLAPEVFRILQSGGTFLTQQVGGQNHADLAESFGVKVEFSDWVLNTMEKQVHDAGLKVRDAREWIGKLEFYDVGAIVYYLKTVPWIVEDFSVERYFADLKKLHAKLDKGEKLIFTQARFLVRAEK